MIAKLQILLGFYLQTCSSRHSQRGRYLGTEMEWRDRKEPRRDGHAGYSLHLPYGLNSCRSLDSCRLADTWLLVPGAQS